MPVHGTESPQTDAEYEREDIDIAEVSDCAKAETFACQAEMHVRSSSTKTAIAAMRDLEATPLQLLAQLPSAMSSHTSVMVIGNMRKLQWTS